MRIRPKSAATHGLRSLSSRPDKKRVRERHSIVGAKSSAPSLRRAE